MTDGTPAVTRYEKIKSLSINDMANFLADIQWDSNEPTSQEMYEWLSEPYLADEQDILYIATDGLQKQLTDMLICANQED